MDTDISPVVADDNQYTVSLEWAGKKECVPAADAARQPFKGTISKVGRVNPCGMQDTKSKDCQCDLET